MNASMNAPSSLCLLVYSINQLRPPNAPMNAANECRQCCSESCWSTERKRSPPFNRTEWEGPHHPHWPRGSMSPQVSNRQERCPSWHQMKNSSPSLAKQKSTPSYQQMRDGKIDAWWSKHAWCDLLWLMSRSVHQESKTNSRPFSFRALLIPAIVSQPGIFPPPNKSLSLSGYYLRNYALGSHNWSYHNIVYKDISFEHSIYI